MVVIAVPAQRRSTLRRRLRIAFARFGSRPRGRVALAALAVLGLMIAPLGLYVVDTPGGASAAVPVADDSSTSRQGTDPPMSTAFVVATSGATSAPPSSPASSSSAGAAPPAAVSALAADGIPVVALQAYENAATLIDVAQPSCHLAWPLLAGIGRVESNHGRSSGQLLTDGTSSPPVMGLLLDGSNGFATIKDTDGGVLDGSASFDRAIGPMQFIPSTWAMYASDGNGDGKADPFNIYDASLAAAKYLCRAGGDLSTPDGLQRAVYSYNHDQSYVDKVLALANEYAAEFNQGLLPIPAVTDTPPPLDPDLPAVNPGPPAPGADGTTSPPSDPGTTAAPSAPGAPTASGPTDPGTPVDPGSPSASGGTDSGAPTDPGSPSDSGSASCPPGSDPTAADSTDPGSPSDANTTCPSPSDSSSTDSLSTGLTSDSVASESQLSS
jgi:membrane-bound lytic murein transglycosylase B